MRLMCQTVEKVAGSSGSGFVELVFLKRFHNIKTTRSELKGKKEKSTITMVYCRSFIYPNALPALGKSL